MNPTKTKKFLIIDSNSLIHRAYHAIPPFKTKNNKLVNAVYGFCSMFLKALQEIKPDMVVACFDLKGPTFRHLQFKDYKAKRIKKPEEFYEQIDDVRKILQVFAVPIFSQKGFEADDLIATLQKKFLQKAEKNGLNPEVVILSGDMDNLQLVSEKVKVFTLRKGFSDTILYDTSKVKEKYNGLLPSQLVDLRALRGDQSDNIPGVKGIGEKTAIALLKEFVSLDNLYQSIEQNSHQSKKIKPAVLKKLLAQKKEAFFCKQLAKMKDDVDLDFDLHCCQIKDFDQKAILDAFASYEFFSLIKRLKESIFFVESANLPQQNFLSGSNKDSFVAPLKEKEAGQTLFDFAFYKKEKEEKKDIFEQIESLKNQGLLSDRVYQLEKNLAPVVERMKTNGIRVDNIKLKKLSQELSEEINNLRQEIQKISGANFNVNSSQQLSEVLFQKLKISSVGMKKTPGGVISTGADELEKIQEQHKVIPLILRYRELFKLKSGFVDSLPKSINSQDGRIHPFFHQLGTETGRMSCSNPNLQNIPTKGRFGRKIRQCFVAEKGFFLLSADYSQMELRVLAFLAQDKKMIDFFSQGKDIHKMVAAEIFEKPEKEITPQQREIAKTLNFGVMYGMGSRKLAASANLTLAVAKEFIKKYFAEFEGVAIFSQKAIEKAKEQGFSKTYFGRKRMIEEINSFNQRLRSQAERIAKNLPGQGTAADIIKMAMVALAQEKVLENDCRLLLQVHDELIFEIKENLLTEKSAEIKKIMEGVEKMIPPLKVKLEAGKSWGEMSAVE